VEEVGEEDALGVEETLEEPVAVEAEHEAGDGAVLLGDGGVVGVEGRGVGAENGHVAVEEEARVFVELGAVELAMAGGELDEGANAGGVERLAREEGGEGVEGQVGATGLVVGPAGDVDRVVEERGEPDLFGGRPAGTGGDGVEVAEDFLDVGERVVGAGGLGVGRDRRTEETFRNRQRRVRQC